MATALQKYGPVKINCCKPLLTFPGAVLKASKIPGRGSTLLGKSGQHVVHRSHDAGLANMCAHRRHRSPSNSLKRLQYLERDLLISARTLSNLVTPFDLQHHSLDLLEVNAGVLRCYVNLPVCVSLG